MKNVNVYLTAFLFLAGLFILTGCGSKQASSAEYTNDNITILLDLSDRIAPKVHTDQVEKDIAAVMEIEQAFKQRIFSKGTFNTNDKIKVIFYPQLKERRIIEIAEKLTINLENLEPRAKKNVFRSLDTLYKNNLTELYNIAVAQQSYSGSDIYNFFKDRVEDDCIIKDTFYHNTLVIISDGYLYWENSRLQDGNRFSFIGPDAVQVKQFRRSPSWETAFDKGDFGFLPIKNSFPELSVLLLEVNPVPAYPEDYDIMKKYWGKWFEEMKIAEYKIVKSDMPVTTKAIIQNYFKNF